MLSQGKKIARKFHLLSKKKMAMIAAGLAMALYAYFPQLLVEHILLDSLKNSHNVELDIVPLEKEPKIQNHEINTQLVSPLEECKGRCINLHNHLSLQKKLPENDNNQ
jgi:hypothetical protein